MKPVKILLVEDNKADVRLTQEALKEFKFANVLTVCQDGIEALAYLDKETPDIIILDLNLPKVSGFEVLIKIKTSEKLKHIPVIILNTSENSDHVRKAYTLGANSYLSKPLELPQFMNTINALGNFWFLVVKLPSN